MADSLTLLLVVLLLALVTLLAQLLLLSPVLLSSPRSPNIVYPPGKNCPYGRGLLATARAPYARP